LQRLRAVERRFGEAQAEGVDVGQIGLEEILRAGGEDEARGLGRRAPLGDLGPPAAHGGAVECGEVDVAHLGGGREDLLRAPDCAAGVAVGVVPDGVAVAVGAVEDHLVARLAQLVVRGVRVHDGDDRVVVAVRRVDGKRGQVAERFLEGVAAGDLAGGETVRVAGAEFKGGAAAHAAAAEVDAAGVDVPVGFDVVDDVEHVGLREAGVPAAAPAAEHVGLKIAVVGGGAGGVFEVVAAVAVHRDGEGRGARGIVIGRDHELEGLAGAVGGRLVGPLLHAAQFAEQLRIGGDALDPVGEAVGFFHRLRAVGAMAGDGALGLETEEFDPAAIGGEVRAGEGGVGGGLCLGERGGRESGAHQTRGEQCEEESEFLHGE